VSSVFRRLTSFIDVWASKTRFLDATGYGSRTTTVGHGSGDFLLCLEAFGNFKGCLSART